MAARQRHVHLRARRWPSPRLTTRRRNSPVVGRLAHHCAPSAGLRGRASFVV